MDSDLLKIKNISVILEKDNKIKNIINKINITCKKSEKIGIVGESGSGKTITALSILKILNKNMRICEGKIYFKDKDILKLSENDFYKLRGNEITMIFQDTINAFNPLIKVGEQIKEVALKHLNINKKEAKLLTLKTIESMSFLDPEIIYNKYAHELSGGMRQRILIASSIICKPSFLIADEPTTSLDVIVQKQVIDILNELNIKNKMSIMFISHDLSVINSISDYIYVMYKGYIVEYGKRDDIIKTPNHPYTKDLIKNIINKKNEYKDMETKNNIYKNIDFEKRCPFLSRCKFVSQKCFIDFPEYKKIKKGHFSMCFNSERE